MLLVESSSAAKFHALAACRAGASWQELHKVIELATAVSVLGAANKGGALLNELKNNETDK